ncbi:hypothetical protein SK128_013495 [Halocaridina rubra]|uniref:Uncharacterized protein n=1 Tax=Halocaridina rubra TaxID=373956 RepID=A0AAN8XRL7_HALRR
MAQDKRNGCLTGMLTVIFAACVVSGVISFIVWSPCREDWPEEPEAANAGMLFRDLDNAGDGPTAHPHAPPSIVLSSLAKGSGSMEPRHSGPPLRPLASPVLPSYLADRRATLL